MQQVDLKPLELAPATKDVLSESDGFRDRPPKWNHSSPLFGQLIEQNDFDSAIPEPARECVLLVEQDDRLEARLLKPDDEIEQRLMGAADGAILVAFDDEHARYALSRSGSGPSRYFPRLQPRC